MYRAIYDILHLIFIDLTSLLYSLLVILGRLCSTPSITCRVPRFGARILPRPSQTCSYSMVSSPYEILLSYPLRLRMLRPSSIPRDFSLINNNDSKPSLSLIKDNHFPKMKIFISFQVNPYIVIYVFIEISL